MNDYNNSEFHKLDLQQWVALEKHQRMIQNALRWQQLSALADQTPKSAIIPQLRLILTALLHLTTK